MRALDINEEILDEWKPPASSHILMVTGKLAHHGLERMMAAIDPKEFTYEIRTLDVNIAAWLNVERVEELIGDLTGFSLIMVPGLMQGDEDELAKHLNISVVRGPKCYSELPTFLEQQGFKMDDDAIPKPHIIVLGDSGADKDAAAFIARQYEIRLIDFTSLLGLEIASGSEYGLEIQASLRAGEPIRHNVGAELVRAEIALSQGRGWVLSGYPQTMRDIQWLDDMGAHPDAIIIIDTDPELSEVREYYEKQKGYVDIDPSQSVADIHEDCVVRIEQMMQMCIVPDEGLARNKELGLE